MELSIFSAYLAPRLIKITSRVTVSSLLFVSLLLLTLIFSGPIRADSRSGVDFVLLSSPQVEVLPHQMLTISARLTNSSPDPATFSIRADTPPGWLLSILPDSVLLASGESSVIFVSVTIPANALAENYVLNLNLFRDDNLLDSDRLDIGVTVASVARLDVSMAGPAAPRATTGEIITRTFTVSNLGNGPDHAFIEIDSNKNWRVVIDPPDLDFILEPGEQRNLSVSVTVPNQLPAALTYHLTVIAYSYNFPELPKPQATMSARIIPTQLTGSIYAALEGDMEFATALHNGSDSSSIFSLGPLHADIGDERSIGLEFRNLLLDGDTSSSFIQRQWSWAEYVDNNEGYFRVGDLSLDLESPLVERYVTGRGAEAFLFGGPYSLRVFHARIRGSTPREDTGLQLGYELGDTGILRFTALQDSDLMSSFSTEEQKDKSTNLGIFALCSPSDDMELTGEVAQSNGEFAGIDSAWRLTGDYSTRQFSANCEWLRAGDEFRGGWNDTERRRMNLWWSPADDITVWALYSLSFNNLDNDPGSVGRHIRNTAFGMSWNIEDFARLRYSRRTIHNWDNTLDTFNRLSHISIYSLTRSWGPVSTTAALENQTNDHRTTGESDSTDRLRFDLSARLNRDAYLRFSYSLGQFSQAGIDGHENVNDFTLASQLRVSDDIRTSLNLRRNSGGLLGNRTDLYGVATWDISRDHSLSFRIRDYSGTYGGDTEIALEYTQPVGIPIGIFPSKGSVDGRVFMFADPSQGIPNVKITVGNIEVFTGDDGRFVIPVLDPGHYQLSIDPATLGIGFLPMIDSPLELTVTAGSTSHIDIPVSQSGQIEGQVFLHTPPTHGRAESTWPMAEITVELLGPDGTSFRLTDSYGHFIFTDLKPGYYILSVRESDIPTDFEILYPMTYELDLLPGDSLAAIDFTISPLARDITISVDKSTVWWEF